MVCAGGLPFADLGVELTPGFRALQVWMSLKAHGVAAPGRVVEQNVRQARYLLARVEAHSDLELLAPVAMNVVCFRVRPREVAAEALDVLNQEVLLQVQESGVAVPAPPAPEPRA